jgi:NADH dehydrogenase
MTSGQARSVCVLGGTGFVGRHLASALIDAGYRVRIPTTNRERHRRLLVLPGVELINADVHDEARLRRLVDGCSAVVNLVGILNEKPRNGTGFHRAHVELVEKLVDACIDGDVKHLVHMSALKANAEHGPSHYLRSKGTGERAVKRLAGDQLHYTILQPSVIFGADDSFTRLFANLVRWFPVLPLVKPNARFAPVYVGDVAAAIVAVLGTATSSGKTYQLCGPDIFSLREIVAAIATTLGHKRLIIGLPDWVGRLQAWLFDYVVPGRILTVDNFKSMTVASVCTEKGLAELDIEPQSLRLIMPTYLGGRDRQRALSSYREYAGR